MLGRNGAHLIHGEARTARLGHVAVGDILQRVTGGADVLKHHVAPLQGHRLVVAEDAATTRQHRRGHFVRPPPRIDQHVRGDDGRGEREHDATDHCGRWLLPHEQRLLLEGLRHLSLGDQTLLELYYWERLSGPELAAFLGVPENTARTRVRRARLRLEAELVALATTPERLKTTVDNLDRWAESIRGALALPA